MVCPFLSDVDPPSQVSRQCVEKGLAICRVAPAVECLLRRTQDGDAPDLDALIERGADPAQHRQGMPLVIGILEAADYGRRGANEFPQLGLR